MTLKEFREKTNHLPDDSSLFLSYLDEVQEINVYSTLEYLTVTSSGGILLSDEDLFEEQE